MEDAAANIQGCTGKAMRYDAAANQYILTGTSVLLHILRQTVLILFKLILWRTLLPQRMW
jgi:hypothetical protein